VFNNGGSGRPGRKLRDLVELLEGVLERVHNFQRRINAVFRDKPADSLGLDRRSFGSGRSRFGAPQHIATLPDGRQHHGGRHNEPITSV
jgi:hypothetical protein